MTLLVRVMMSGHLLQEKVTIYVSTSIWRYKIKS